ncbi:MAG: ribosome small subunit-dependent GTPase A [Gemmatimonadaceae bacterium]
MTLVRTNAVVLTGTGGVWQLRTESGETVDATLRGRLKQDDAPKLAVGDAVSVEREGSDDAGTIVEIFPRRSCLARRAPGGRHGERVVAANVDQVVVVFAAAKPDPHPRMLDRFLVIAEGNRLSARVVINKAELPGADAVHKRVADDPRAGYPLHATSVKADLGRDALLAALAGQTSVVTGPSGVGKSSLMNFLYPGLDLRVGAVSDSVNKGRHTTVGAFLHPLPDGGYVVDTPGLREVGMWGLPSTELDHCFPEFRPYLESCRFGDCTHIVEPDCGVRTAVESEDVSRARYESYVKLRAELGEGDNPW